MYICISKHSKRLPFRAPRWLYLSVSFRTFVFRCLHTVSFMLDLCQCASRLDLLDTCSKKSNYIFGLADLRIWADLEATNKLIGITLSRPYNASITLQCAHSKTIMWLMCRRLVNIVILGEESGIPWKWLDPTMWEIRDIHDVVAHPKESTRPVIDAWRIC